MHASTVEIAVDEDGQPLPKRSKREPANVDIALPPGVTPKPGPVQIYDYLQQAALVRDREVAREHALTQAHVTWRELPERKRKYLSNGDPLQWCVATEMLQDLCFDHVRRFLDRVQNELPKCSDTMLYTKTYNMMYTLCQVTRTLLSARKTTLAYAKGELLRANMFPDRPHIDYSCLVPDIGVQTWMVAACMHASSGDMIRAQTFYRNVNPAKCVLPLGPFFYPIDGISVKGLDKASWSCGGVYPSSEVVRTLVAVRNRKCVDIPLEIIYKLVDYVAMEPYGDKCEEACAIGRTLIAMHRKVDLRPRRIPTLADLEQFLAEDRGSGAMAM